jgi:hypothetical protein
MAAYREPGAIAQEMGMSTSNLPTPQQYNRLLAQVLAERDQLQKHIMPFEEIRPDVDDLMDLHIKLIAYLRAMLMGESLRAASMRQEILGNGHVSSSHLAESKEWEALRLENRREATQALLSLKDHSRWLFTSLGLEEGTVTDLLRYDCSSSRSPSGSRNQISSSRRTLSTQPHKQRMHDAT